ncbi:MAG: cytochrome B [Zetaproteobacteria bacterium CG2_30_46_52]|nr:MAG: cytochrome B [Zetaproteobacteria bacterium CG2_30_46_52]
MKRYHPALVTLHWLLALMIITALIMGGAVMAEIPNSNPEKIDALKGHMSFGIIILSLMIIRLVVRFFTAKPPADDAGNATLNKIGVATHYAFYVVVILMALSGMATSIMAGLPDIVFGGSGAPLPETFNNLPPRIAHGILGALLGLLICAHIGAALFHQFIRKDNLFSRMWFGKRG